MENILGHSKEFGLYFKPNGKWLEVLSKVVEWFEKVILAALLKTKGTGEADKPVKKLNLHTK